MIVYYTYSYSTTKVEIKELTNSKPINFQGELFVLNKRKKKKKFIEGKAIDGGSNFQNVSLIGLRIMKSS